MPVTVLNDYGGSLFAYVAKAERYSERGIRIGGRCESACTMYIAARNVCIIRGASFGFHKPSGASPEANAIAERFMLRRYPPWVRSWIAAHGGLTKAIKRMNFAYASQFMPVC